MNDVEYYELYGEWRVYARNGHQQYRFPGYSYCYDRFRRFHRQRPFRAL